MRVVGLALTGNAFHQVSEMRTGMKTDAPDTGENIKEALSRRPRTAEHYNGFIDRTLVFLRCFRNRVRELSTLRYGGLLFFSSVKLL
jgi:hypothetical protein